MHTVDESTSILRFLLFESAFEDEVNISVVKNTFVLLGKEVCKLEKVKHKMLLDICG